MYRTKYTKELLENRWNGRQWILGNFYIYFIKDDASSGVRLLLEQIDDEFINKIENNKTS